MALQQITVDSTLPARSSASAPRRFHELDALRGLAACVVMLRHFVMAMPEGNLHFLLLRTPLRVFFAAHEAVLLFFLLSGFVLSVSAPGTYFAYIAKRICRIYLPYLAALLLAVLGAAYLHGVGSTPSEWFATTWSGPVSKALVFQHVLFLGKYDVAQFNTAFWSLVYEMRVSIFFPLVYLAARRISIGWIAAMAFVASSIASALHSSPYSADYAMTFHYAAIFCLGSLLAQRRDALCLRIQALKGSTVIWMTVLCLGLFTYGQGPLSVIRRFEPLTDWPVVFGCCGLVLLSIGSDRIGSFLRSAIPQFLGRISYSLYLVHATVLFALIHLLYGRWPLPLILALFLPLSITLGWVFHLAIEVPAIRAGRMAQARLRPRSTIAKTSMPFPPEMAVADAPELTVNKSQNG